LKALPKKTLHITLADIRSFPPRAILVAHRRLYYVSQLKLLALVAPPKPYPLSGAYTLYTTMIILVTKVLLLS